MNFILSKKQFDFLISLNGVQDFILNKNIENDSVIFQVQNVGNFQDEIYFNVVEYGMDGEGKVNDLGKRIYSVYDELLYQKYNSA